MVRHKNRPLRSLTQEETSCIVTKQEDAARESEDEATRNGAGKTSPSPSLSFWSVDWAAETPLSPQLPPPGKPTKSNKGGAASLTSSRDGSLPAADSSSTSSSLSASISLSSIMAMSKHSSPLPDESEGDSEEDLDDYCHPLSNSQGMPAFSDLQVTIAKAIVKRSGRRDGAANVEDILDYVTKKWKNLRRKDGSQYSSASTYIRRAVQANLRSTANGLALFKMEMRGDEAYWSVCQTLEEAKAAISGAQPSKPTSAPSSTSISAATATGSISGSSTSASSTRESVSTSTGASNAAAQSSSAQPAVVKREAPASPVAPAPPSSESPVPELTKEELQYYEAAQSRMTALQRTVSECILQSGGSCHFEFILDTVQKKWVDIKNEDGLPRIANIKRLVGACVARDRGEDAKALFMRDHNAESSGYWKLGLSNPYARTSGLPAVDAASSPSPSAAQQPEAKTLAVDASAVSVSASGGSRRNAPLTHLQELILDAIAEHGEAADLESIHAYIKERWQGLTRRDGTPYAADVRKAIQSSLSNASSLSPIFVKLAEADPCLWGLTARGKLLLRERQQKRQSAAEQDLMEEDNDGGAAGGDEDDGDDGDAYGARSGVAGPSATGSSSNGGGQSLGQAAGKKRRKKAQFSGIQQMIAEVMHKNGGSAPFEMILVECQKQWRTLRKRDGTPYNADPKRSINASLTKTPAYGQVFERDPRHEGSWRLTSAAQLVWDQLRRSGDGELAPEDGADEDSQQLLIKSENENDRENENESESESGRAVSSKKKRSCSSDDVSRERKREAERERREKRRRHNSDTESVQPASGSSSPDGEGAPALMTMDEGGDASKADSSSATPDVVDQASSVGELQQNEAEPEEAGATSDDNNDDDELEYGEGDADGEAPRLASMQAMVIRAICKFGGSGSFEDILDTLCEKVEKDKTLMAAVNWARVHRSNFLASSSSSPDSSDLQQPQEEAANSHGEEADASVRVFARDAQGRWTVPDAKLRDWVLSHKRKRAKASGAAATSTSTTTTTTKAVAGSESSGSAATKLTPRNKRPRTSEA